MSDKELTKEELVALLMAENDNNNKPTKKAIVNSTECSFNATLTSEGEIEFSWSTRPNKPTFTKEQVKKILSNFETLSELLK
jgi:hypothetical protein